MLTTFLTIFIFYKAANHSKPALAVILIWLALQSLLSISGFYKVTDSMPPHFVLLVAPPVLFIIILFVTGAGRKFIGGLNLRLLTLLHTIRIAVELVLFFLFLHKVVPEIMTYEGKNFDIISGLTAPFIFYRLFIKKSVNYRWLLLWNFICLGLLVNIVALAVGSAPFPFQQLAFEQPDIAILYFPFTWLSCCIVPLVLFSHLAAIRQIICEIRKQPLTKNVIKTENKKLPKHSI
jgi:hypothetical protein